MKSNSEIQKDKMIQLQAGIKSLLASPPKAISNWSYQKAVEFKKVVKSAETLLAAKEAKGAKLMQMQQTLDRLGDYYK